MTERREIALICTDRGSHREWILQSWWVDDTSPVWAMMPTFPGSYIEYNDCPHCPRTPRIRADRLRRLLDHLLSRTRNGERRVVADLSKLNL